MFFTDTHVRTTSPRYRLDNFYERSLKKLLYVAQLGQEYDVDAFISGGDWIDRPDIPYASLSGLTEILTKFKKPIYTVLGNHCIYGYNPDTHHRTAMSVIRASGLITRLSMDNPIIIEKDGTKVSLTGCDAHSQLDKNGRTSDYTDVPEIDAVRIHTVHGFLSKKPWNIVPVTLIDDVLDTKADVLLTGHEHSGYGVIKKNGKIFCNPGALLRVTASVGDVNLEVKVALIRIDGKDVSIDLIRLPPHIAPPANEVIDRAKLEEEKQHMQTLATFSASTKDAVKKFSLGQGFNLYKMLEHVAEENELSQEVVDIMKKQITLAEEELAKEV